MSKYDIKYVRGKEAREIYQVSQSTLLRWANSGKIPTLRTRGGHRLYSIEGTQADQCSVSASKRKIIYCRVSSQKQKDDLQRQIQNLKSHYPDHSVITDIGSGINWKRKGLKEILEQAMSGHISEIVIAHRDRLCRFAFELLEWILETNGVKLLVHNAEKNTEEDELASDLLSIVQIFCCKKNGRRRYKTNCGDQKDKIVHDTSD